jgi:hypothetical protein
MHALGKTARLLVLIVTVSGVASPPCFAARHVPITVSVDGKVVIKAGWGDNGEPDADTVWRYLQNIKLQPADAAHIEAERENPLQGALRGDVIINVGYGGRAEVSTLKFVRATENAPWQIAPADVERTFQTRHKPYIFTVSVGGKRALSTVERTRKGKTADDPDNVWRSLRQLTIYGRKIAPTGDDPLHATLTGGVTIELRYAGQSWGKSDISELKLHRGRPNALWSVEPADVELTLKNRLMPSAGDAGAADGSNQSGSAVQPRTTRPRVKPPRTVP